MTASSTEGQRIGRKLCHLIRLFAAGLAITGVVIGCEGFATGQGEPIEPFYDARFPRDCAGMVVVPQQREELRGQIRLELKKVNPAITAIGVLDIKCARSAGNKTIGAVVLAYGAADLDKAYEEFQKAGPETIGSLLENEQYGVFQYDADLRKPIKTLKVFRSQRWRDYLASIELASSSRLILRGSGSYGDQALIEEIKLMW